jgi:hypothetical protein
MKRRTGGSRVSSSRFSSHDACASMVPLGGDAFKKLVHAEENRPAPLVREDIVFMTRKGTGETVTDDARFLELGPMGRAASLLLGLDPSKVYDDTAVAAVCRAVFKCGPCPPKATPPAAKTGLVSFVTTSSPAAATPSARPSPGPPGPASTPGADSAKVEVEKAEAATERLENDISVILQQRAVTLTTEQNAFLTEVTTAINDTTSVDDIVAKLNSAAIIDALPVFRQVYLNRKKPSKAKIEEVYGSYTAAQCALLSTEVCNSLKAYISTAEGWKTSTKVIAGVLGAAVLVGGAVLGYDYVYNNGQQLAVLGQLSMDSLGKITDGLSSAYSATSSAVSTAATAIANATSSVASAVTGSASSVYTAVADKLSVLPNITVGKITAALSTWRLLKGLKAGTATTSDAAMTVGSIIAAVPSGGSAAPKPVSSWTSSLLSTLYPSSTPSGGRHRRSFRV